MRKSDVENVNGLEQYYSSVKRKIKFNKDVKITSILDIKKELFNNSQSTYYKRGSLHCGTDRYRSFDDFFILCKTYFPKKTIKDFAKVLLADEILSEKKISVRYCPNIRKTNSGGIGRFSYNNFYTSPGHKMQLGFKDKYSLIDIINN